MHKSEGIVSLSPHKWLSQEAPTKFFAQLELANSKGSSNKQQEGN
jgi:hypothetical protein